MVSSVTRGELKQSFSKAEKKINSVRSQVGSLTADDIADGTSNQFYTNEKVDDRVAALLVAGTNVTLTYNDGAGTLTVDVTGSGSYTNEEAQDAVGAMVDSSLVYVDATPLLTRAALTGDITASQGSNTLTIGNDKVTYAKMQNVSAASKLLGRGDSGSGDPQEITVGSGLTMTGTTLSSAGGTDISGGWATAPANPGWDPNFSGALTSAVTLSNSNKTLTPASSGPYNHAAGTPGRASGKYYFEIVPGSASFTVFGMCSGPGRAATFPGSNNFGTQLGQLGWEPGGSLKAYAPSGGYTVTSIQTWTTSNDLCFAVNMDAGLIWFRTNGGNWNNSATANPATNTEGIALAHALNGASSGLIWPGGNMGNTSAHVMHLLSGDFARSVPSGYSPWGGS